MAYTRNTVTTLGAAANHLIILQDDGSTVIDIGSTGSTPVKHANCTVGTMTWNSVSRAYVETKLPGSTNFNGITWASGNPGLTHAAANGAGFFIAMALGTIDTMGHIAHASNYGLGVKRTSNSSAFNYISGNDGDVTVVGSTFGSDFSNRVCYMGWANSAGGASSKRAISDVDGGTKNALDVNAVEPGYTNSAGTLQEIGGWNGQGSHAIRLLCLAIFNNRSLSLADFQALRNDWFGELVNAPAAATGPGARTSDVRAQPMIRGPM